MRMKQLAYAIGLIGFAGMTAVHADDQAPAQKVEKIEVTGSSIKRIAKEGALPVTVIKREDIERSGAPTVADLVKQLSSNNGGGYSFAQGVGDSARPGLSGASLRGLGFGRTLILLNGRRMATYAFGGEGVDLNSIPLSALERVELLRDGASAIYGSDAIGGVLNFITRKDYTGFEVSGGGEMPEKTGGESYNGNMTIGYGDLAQQRFNVLGMLDYQDTKHVLAKDRDFGSSGIIPQYGVSRTSGNAFPANIASADFSQIFRNPAWNKCDPANGSLWLGSATSCREDYTHYIDLQPSQKHTSALARGVFQVAENHQLQAEFSYSKVETTGASAPAPSITTGKDPYYYPAGGKYYPSQLLNKKGQVVNYTGDLALSWRIFPGGRRTEVDSVQESRALLGGNGTLFDRVDYKWAYTHAESKGDVSYTDGWLSDAALRTALATGNVNPFGPQDSTGQALIDAAKIHGTIRSSVYKADTIDASGSSEIAELPAGPVMLGAGVEHHKDKYSDGYLGVVSTGDVVGGSGPQQPVAGERTVNAVFAELNVPIFKNVESQLALRRDHYSDFGSSTNPKIGLRWQPMKELLFRASAGKGFRAPTLDNLYAPQSLTNLGGNFNDPFYDSIVGCANSANPNYCNTQLTARQGGNAKLKAEKSNQWSIGVVFEPSANFSAGLDYFRINLTDAISFVSGDFIIQDWYAHQTGPTTSTSRYAGNMVRDPNTGYLNYIQAGFENAGSIQVGGFDFNMKGRIRTSFGTISPSLEGTYFTRSRQLSVGATEYANQIGIYAQSGPTIRLKTNTGVTWSKGPWEAGGNYVWQDGYLDYSGSRDVASYGLTNLQSSYSGIKNLKVTFGVNNAFNVKPPFSDQGDYFQVGFDPTYADVRLRTWYLRGSYKFW